MGRLYMGCHVLFVGVSAYFISDRRTIGHDGFRAISPMFRSVYGFTVRQTGFMFGALR